MSFNLPASRLLKVTKGRWEDVSYPTNIFVEANLTPRDYFEPVSPESSRSCIPANGKNFKYCFDANIGKLSLRGETMFPPVSVKFDINDDLWDVIFQGRAMHVRQRLESFEAIDGILTGFEYAIPTLLSVVTGLSVFCESIELSIGDDQALEARAETLLPPHDVRVIPAESRISDIQAAIQMLGVTLSSSRLGLAASYCREALYFEASYFSHNPYMLSLVSILRCAQAVEVLFGGKRDTIRDRCKQIGIESEIVESQIIPIVLTRNSLGSAHASRFVPTLEQSEILRVFAQRSANTIRQLILHIHNTPAQARDFLNDPIKRDKDKDELIASLKQHLETPEWSVHDDHEIRELFIPDPRM